MVTGSAYLGGGEGIEAEGKCNLCPCNPRRKNSGIWSYSTDLGEKEEMQKNQKHGGGRKFVDVKATYRFREGNISSRRSSRMVFN